MIERPGLAVNVLKPHELAFLDAFYKGNGIETQEEEPRIAAIRKVVAPDGMTISVEAKDELRALEYYLLLKNGFDV